MDGPVGAEDLVFGNVNKTKGIRDDIHIEIAEELVAVFIVELFLDKKESKEKNKRGLVGHRVAKRIKVKMKMRKGIALEGDQEWDDVFLKRVFRSEKSTF